MRPSTVGGVGTAATVELRVAAPRILVTADTAVVPLGSITVHVRGAVLPGGEVTCDALSGRNVTDMVLDGCDLNGAMGKLVTLQLRVAGGASLYMVGFHS